MIETKNLFNFDSNYDELNSQAEVYNLVRKLAKSRMNDCSISKSIAEGYAWLELVRFSNEKLNEINDKIDRLLMMQANENGERH